MKAIVRLLLAVLLIAGLIGCTTTTKHADMKVKCPSCGALFDHPAHGP